MRKKILLIGASAGGPSQIRKILSSITSLKNTIIIIQHMQEDILPFFIKDLQKCVNAEVKATPCNVNFDESGVVVCSHSSVILKDGYSYKIIDDTHDQKYTPDINKFFRSFDELELEHDISVLMMTGMGDDGVDGAVLLKKHGADILAEDEESCPVYGMPKVAVQKGIVSEVKSLDQIIKYIKGF